MNKSVILKICSIILTVVMCLTVVTACQRRETVTSSPASKTESNFERPDTNNSTSKDEFYSDDTTNEDTSSEEESGTDESNGETTDTVTENTNEDTSSEEESDTDESKGETTDTVTENTNEDTSSEEESGTDESNGETTDTVTENTNEDASSEEESGTDESNGETSDTVTENTNEDTSSEEESGTDESKGETSDTVTENTNEDTSSEEESGTDESNGETTTVVTENVPYDADKNPLKRGINFNGLESSEDIGDEDWKLQGKYYDLVRDKGFDHVRVPVDFFCRMGEAPEYKIDEGFLHKVDRIINLALSANLKVVLDFHHFGEMQTNVEGNKQKFYKMWEQLAEHYQKYPSGLVFELFNEPGNGSALSAGGPDLMTPSKLIEIQDQAIKIIRKTNPTRLIVHATSWNNSYYELMNTEPLLPDDENLIMSAHVYEPMKFTHQGTSWDNPNADNTPHDFTDDMKYEIELAFQMVKNYQEKYGRPVWIGEFGAYNRIAPEGARTKYADFIVKEMKKAKCGWAWWAFKAEFGVYNINTDEWQEDGTLIDALMQ